MKVLIIGAGVMIGQKLIKKLLHKTLIIFNSKKFSFDLYL